MNNLVSTFKTDYILKWTVGHMGYKNNQRDFHVGDCVVVLNSIDGDTSIKFGTIGNIDHIMRRYTGQPAEHYEFWVTAQVNRARYQLYDIIKYDQVKKLIEE